MRRVLIGFAVLLALTCKEDEPKGPPSSRGKGQPETTLPAELPPSTPPPANTTALAVLVGLSQYDPKAYANDDGKCPSCDDDAIALRDRASARGFTTRLLTEKAATAANITNSITAAAKRLKSGDTFLLAFSGHGGQLLDSNDREPTGYDSTWCAYDRQLLDDEVFNALTEFASGVRVLVLADSCHSGTVVFMQLKAAFDQLNGAVTVDGRRVRLPKLRPGEIDLAFRDQFKYLPRSVARATYKAHKRRYDKIRKETPHRPLSDLKASVVLLAATTDDGVAKQAAPYSTFTQAVLNALDQQPATPLQDTFTTIFKAIKADQTPSYCALPPRDCTFESQPLLTLAPAACAPLKNANCVITR